MCRRYACIEEQVQEPLYADFQDPEFEVFEQQPAQDEGKCPWPFCTYFYLSEYHALLEYEVPMCHTFPHLSLSLGNGITKWILRHA